MGQKDITEKMLADYNDVFADIVNVLLFGGRQVVNPEDLQNTKDKRQLKVAGKIHEEERDVSKIYQKKSIRISFIGLEHQTSIDKDEPFRVIGYDGVSYKAQLLEGKERYPVVTLVLYFGTEKRWDKAKSIYEALDIPDEWKPYVNNYKINLFEIAYLSDEQVSLFKSDFKIVADYFVQIRKNKDYKSSAEEIKHVDSVLKLMSVLTNDERFQKAQNDNNGKEIKTMCEVFDRYEEKGEIKGRIAVYYNEMHLSVKEISEKLGMKESAVKEIISTL